jgi:predicted dehydrogenase
MIKLGILDFDTSHAVEFTKRLNHQIIKDDQWVEGASIVIGCPGESKLSPERIPGFTLEMEKMGVPLVEKPTDMIGKVDGMLIEAVDGSVHFERAKPFLEAGIPCFIDKPFACSVADAKKIIELAAKKKVPLFSSSSLRYAPELVQAIEDGKQGKIVGAISYGLGTTHERNPGLFHYGIHAVEILYTAMGPGCQRVTCTHEAKVDVVTGHWKDGRVATVRANRDHGGGSYGVTLFAEKGATHLSVPTTYIYRELLKKIVEFFKTGTSPLPIEVTLEMVSFMEAAIKSGNNHGAGEKV